MGTLRTLPNISKQIELDLNQAGIRTVQELKTLGSRAAFDRIRQHKPEACINMLYALEGAILEVRWHQLEAAHKHSLLEFYRSL